MGKFPIPDNVLYVCTGSKCAKRGGKSMYKIAKALAKYDDSFEVVRTECTDRCDWAPVCAIQPGNTWLKEYSEKEVLKLLQKQRRGED
ncbi:(2Fe-2S) ferredoxin domain-containing protein [Mucilaginibacter mali]|uniref:(2Fe-2S) ferredoxin domain-containing protein n=1 Tax=Mucilaginibacter mali TaxID=2740462 RepID=A0A7D4QFU1_9SPHI|nr:(2Fe-2S) ferredoxin domain-containing protein [Mucilaginibacter mali]QKJ30612.1 (2Fe-2S) ferredoxin domain-containing protein [Mucilaginibacter mali]